MTKADLVNTISEKKNEYRYKAFISYSHAADNKLAPMLQSALHRFAKPFYLLRAINTFLDKTSLHLTPKLWPLIQEALAKSEFFVILASPMAANSPWVQDEIDEWLRIHSDSVDKILIVLTDGKIEWNSFTQDFNWRETTALPKNLQNKFKSEPLYSDLRWIKKSDDLSFRHPQFLDEIGSLAAALHGKPKDAMIGKDLHQYRIFKIVSSLVTITLISLVGVTSFAYYSENRARKEAERQSRVSLSRQLAAQAVNLFGLQHDLALLLNLEANRLGNSVEVRASLIDALRYSPNLLSFLHGHKDVIYSLAFSSDNKALASGSADNAIILWDVVNRQPLGKPLKGHSDWVTSVSFSPDDKVLATASTEIILWDVAKQEPLSPPLKGHTASITSIAFSPDGKKIASGSYDKSIMIWEFGSNKHPTKLSPIPTGGVRSVVYSPDGSILASAVDPESYGAPAQIILWDTSNLQQSGKALVGHTDLIDSLVFSPDGKTLASSSKDHNVILWDVDSRQPKGGPLTFHNGTVFDLAFSPDGKRLITCSYDRKIIIWDVATHNPVEVFKGHGDRVFSLALSSDGNLLASGGGNGSILLWTPFENQPFNKVYNSKDLNGDDVYNVIFSPDGSMLAVAGGRKRIITLWDAASGLQIGQSFTGHKDIVFDVAFSPNNKILVSGSADKSIILWNIETHQPIVKPLIGHTDFVMDVEFSPDSKLIASASMDKTIILWDAETHQALGQPLTAHTDQVNSLAFSPEGKILASGGDDAIIFWDITTKRMIGKPITSYGSPSVKQNHTLHRIQKVIFSPDGKTLVTSDIDANIMFWDVATQKPKAPPLIGDENRSMVNDLAFSSDGKILVSSSNNGNVIIWDYETLLPIGKPLSEVGTRVAISPKHMTLAISGGKFIYWRPSSDSAETSSTNITDIPIDTPNDGDDPLESDDTLESDVESKVISLYDLSLNSWKERARRIANRELTKFEKNKYMR